MKNNSMIVDEQKKGIIDYCANMGIYSVSPWGLNWSWCYEEWLKYDTSEDSASEDSTSEDEW